MCVDYRKLNEKTIKDAYPLTRIDENLDTLDGADWYTSLDLDMAYHGSWINNYLCNQCLSPLKLRVGIPQMARCTLYNTR
jgi:hypothetical protein